jgi:hypothetical protein
MRAKTINFERNKDPKSSLGLGLLNEITSDDLSLLEFGWIYNEQKFDEEEFIREYRFSSMPNKEFERQFNRVKSVAKILDGNIIFHKKHFDWKEEDQMKDFLKTRPYIGYPYIYDAAPSFDDWRLVFSKVKLPNAAEMLLR